MLDTIKQDVDQLVTEWLQTDFLKEDDLFVVGCSTSEVAGKQIGTSGSEDVAAVIFNSLKRLEQDKKIHLVFQCCEHLNRAIVLEKSVQEKLNIEPVSVVPIPTAGGSMASYAYNHLEDAVVVEEIK